MADTAISHHGVMEPSDTAWVLSAAPLVMLMQLGFAMVEGGSVREINVVATYAKNIFDLIIGGWLASFFGFAIAYEHRHTNPHPLTWSFDDQQATAFFWHVCFQATAATIISGAMAERTTVLAYAIVSAITSGVLFSVAVRFTWGEGWLYERGFHDFAGSAVVHAVGGFAALAGSVVVGPRDGRFGRGTAHEFVPNSVPSVLSGVLMLFVCFFGFNTGSTNAMSTFDDARKAGLAAMTTMLASIAAATMAIVIGLVLSRGKGFDLLAVVNALLSGLVGITAGCDVIDPGPACAVGFIAGLVYVGASKVLKVLEIDDVVDSFPIHGATGCWGCIAVGFFHRDKGLLYSGSAELLAEQLLGCVVLSLLAALPTAAVSLVLKRAGLLRVSRETEATGLDHEFGLAAYSSMSETREVLRRCQRVAGLLKNEGYTPQVLLDALITLRGIIFRPFTPQAGDHTLEGEVKDILVHMSHEGLENGADEYLMFLSHHKVDAGDATRIFADTARRLVLGRANLRKPAQPRASPTSRRRQLEAGVPSVAEEGDSSQDSSQRDGSHGQSPPTGRVQATTFRSRLRRATSTQGVVAEGEDKRWSTAPPGTLHHDNVFFLDSSNLKDLKGLVANVKASSNHVLLLSRSILMRPWCLVELAAAHAIKKNLVVVMINFPGKEGDPKGFRFPQDLEVAIQEWTLYATATGGTPKTGNKIRKSFGSVAKGRLSRRSSADESTARSDKSAWEEDGEDGRDAELKDRL